MIFLAKKNKKKWKTIYEQTKYASQMRHPKVICCHNSDNVTYSYSISENWLGYSSFTKQKRCSLWKNGKEIDLNVMNERWCRNEMDKMLRSDEIIFEALVNLVWYLRHRWRKKASRKVFKLKLKAKAEEAPSSDHTR